MSELTDFTFVKESDAPRLGELLGDWATSIIGADILVVAGHVAFDANNHVISVRPYLIVREDKVVNLPHGDGKEAYDDYMDWLAREGAAWNITFGMRYKRPAPLHPNSADLHLFDSNVALSAQHDLHYEGHLITNGDNAHGLLVLEGGHIQPDVRGDAEAPFGYSVDDVVIDTPEVTQDIVDEMFRRIEAKLERPRSERPMDVPDINKRPEIPKAFLN